MKRVLTLTLGLAALSVGPAMAADIPMKAPVAAPVMAPVTSWTGCYIGGHAGYAWSQTGLTYNNGAGIIETFNFNPSSFIGGGQAGCQYQFLQNWVFGVEGTWSSVRLNQTDISVLAPPRQRSLGIDQIWTVTGRLGYTWDRWMLYAKGGLADAQIDTFAINPTTGIFGDSRQWQGGWTVGGGLEYMILPSIVLGAEFNYYRFQFDRTFVNSDATISAVTASRADVYSAMARASWLFNFGGGPVVARY